MALNLNGITIANGGVFIPFSLLGIPSTTSAEIILAAIIKTFLSEISDEIGTENNELICNEAGDVIGFDNRDYYRQTTIYFWGTYCASRNKKLVLRKEVILEINQADETN